MSLTHSPILRHSELRGFGSQRSSENVPHWTGSERSIVMEIATKNVDTATRPRTAMAKARLSACHTQPHPCSSSGNSTHSDPPSPHDPSSARMPPPRIDPRKAVVLQHVARCQRDVDVDAGICHAVSMAAGSASGAAALSCCAKQDAPRPMKHFSSPGLRARARPPDPAGTGGNAARMLLRRRGRRSSCRTPGMPVRRARERTWLGSWRV